MRQLVYSGLAVVVLTAGCVSSSAGVKAASGPVEGPTQAPVSGPVAMPRLPRDSGWTVPVPVGPIAAPGEIVEPVPGGVIDWGARVVRARGSGVLDPADENRSRARLMAERAAVVVAQRNLLEIIKGVRVDADTKVENFVTSYDVIYTRVEGVVKGARPVGPAKYDSAAGVVEVELEVSLDGPQSVADALQPALGAGTGSVQAEVSPAVQEFFRQYSGLVLDAGPDLIHYQYELRGVAYFASQDVSALRGLLPEDPARLAGPVNVKYDPRNPANSIVLCEEWSGLPGIVIRKERTDASQESGMEKLGGGCAVAGAGRRPAGGGQ
jgi:hypothetical protein